MRWRGRRSAAIGCVFALMAIGLISSTLGGIYAAAVYRYAAEGETGTFFSADLVRGAWVRYVRQHNLHVLGETSDLNELLFGSERASLPVERRVLIDIQRGRKFCLPIWRPCPDFGQVSTSPVVEPLAAESLWP